MAYMDVATGPRWMRRESVRKNVFGVACRSLAIQPELYKGVQQVLKKLGRSSSKSRAGSGMV